nr:uncharacterized protein LOC107386223 [Nothobranchius furzeri]
MDNSAAKKSHLPRQTWIDQNGWPTTSSERVIINPYSSSQHLSQRSLCDQTPFYSHPQASGQSCLSSLNMSSVDSNQNAVLFKTSHLNTLSSSSILHSTDDPGASHQMSFAQQAPHTSSMQVATRQGKTIPPPSLPQPNHGIQPFTSQNPAPLSPNNFLETFHTQLLSQGLPNRLPDQSFNMSSGEQSGNMSQATFGVGGADVEASNSYESSTSQKQPRWIPSSLRKGASVQSASYSDVHVDKQQKKDVSSVADIEKHRLTILKQRAQLLQQLEGLNVLLESLPQSKCNNEQLSHKTVQDNLSDNQEEPVSPAESADQQVEKTYSESEDENGSNYGSTSDGNVSDCMCEDTTDSEDCPAEESTTQTKTQKKPSERVVVPMTTRKRKLIFDTRNYCLFCSKPVLKMSRHLTNVHSDRAEVAVAFQRPMNSKERKQVWQKLTKEGNFAHNKYVLQTGKGQLAVRARPTKLQKATDYVHCVYCFGIFAKKNVWKHLKTCSEKPEKANETKDKRSLVTQCAILTKNCENLSEGFKNVLCEMQYDDVTEAVIKDQILLQFGEQMFSEYSDDVKNHQYIRQNLRLVARLLLEAQKSTPMQTLEDFFQPSNFKHVVSAVKSVAGYDPETKTFTTPSLAFKVGYNLQKICSVVEGTAVKNGDAKAEEACKIFQSLYQKKWNKHISSRAFRNLKETKKKNKADAPFVEDVKRLHDHMEKVHRDAEEKLKENVCSENYLALAKVVLAQILVFNKRKAREVTSISLTAFRSRKKSDVPGDIDVSVSDLEKTLCGFFSRVDIKGNCGRMLPVLLKPSFESAIELLISVREECGVPKDNPFVFGIPSPFPSSTLKGSVCTQIFVKECGAEKPAALTILKLRQHFATMLPRIYLKEDEFRQIFGPKRQTQAVRGEAGVECYEGQQPDSHKRNDVFSSLFGPGHLNHQQETTTSSIIAEFERKYVLQYKSKPKWDEAEVQAVEKHLIRFIREHKLPQKGDCIRCLEAEPCALRNRSWKGLKDYVRNRITALQRESGIFMKSLKTREKHRLKRPQKSSVRSQPSNKLEAARERHDVVPSSNVEPTQRPHGATTYSKASTPKSPKPKTKGLNQKVKHKWDEEEIRAVEEHLMHFIRTQKVPQKDDCVLCLEAEPDALRNRSWKGIKDYVRNRITTLQRQSGSSTNSAKYYTLQTAKTTADFWTLPAAADLF